MLEEFEIQYMEPGDVRLFRNEELVGCFADVDSAIAHANSLVVEDE
jgi:hypothetical protein